MLLTTLISLNLSAAFDTIDHTILLSRLQTSFSISGLALAWFRSYLEGCSQFFRIGCFTSPVTLCTTVVPQGSVLGPMLLYSSHPLHVLSVHMTSCSSSTLKTLSSMSPYPKTITILQSPNWSYVSRPSIPGSAITVSTEPRHIWGNRVWHYPAFTFSSNYLYCQWRQNPCPDFQSDQHSWRYPWLYTLFDAHISALLKSCFYHIRALRHICPNLTLDCFKNIACSLIGYRLEYAISTLMGISIKTIAHNV